MISYPPRIIKTALFAQFIIRCRIAEFYKKKTRRVRVLL
nr:MAG TPA: hypothetical protein [Bacteriophage sp.]